MRQVMAVFRCTFGEAVLGGEVSPHRFGVCLAELRSVAEYQLTVLSALVLTKLHSKNAYTALF